MAKYNTEVRHLPWLSNTLPSLYFANNGTPDLTGPSFGGGVDATTFIWGAWQTLEMLKCSHSLDTDSGKRTGTETEQCVQETRSHSDEGSSWRAWKMNCSLLVRGLFAGWRYKRRCFG